jgi:hypothetical protein
MSWLNKNRDSQAASTSTSDTRETLQADDLDDQPIDVDALTPTPSQAEEPEETEHEEAAWRSETRSDRFMDAYRKGLNGTQAAWAGKRYRGHRVLPKNIMALIDRFFRQKNQ